MESQRITGQKTMRGFNLIESAIVLGVVGAVIGGIWSAYANYKRNMIAEQVFKGVTTMAQTLLPLFPCRVLAQNGDSWEARIAYGNAALTLLAGKLDGFTPGGTSRFGGIPGFLTPMGTNNGYPTLMIFRPKSNVIFGSEGLRIEVYLDEVPKDICRRLAARVKGLMDSDPSGNGLFKGISFGGASYGGDYAWQAYYVHKQYYHLGYRYDDNACRDDRNSMSFAINTPP